MPIISRMPHCGHALMREIQARSTAKDWRDARREWEISRVFFSEPDNPGRCLCGHFPIREHCVLRNRVNGNVVTVGNVCVKRFFDLNAEDLFAAFRKIMKNLEATMSAKAIDYAHGRDWINDWERDHCLSICGRSKRKLSPRQLAKRVEIHKKILVRLTEREGRHDA